MVAISQEGKEAYQKSQQVAKSSESNTSSDQSGSQNAAFKSFPEGNVKQLTPEKTENDPVRNEVASANAQSGQESVKNASKLENFELNPAITAMQETALKHKQAFSRAKKYKNLYRTAAGKGSSSAP